MAGKKAQKGVAANDPITSESLGESEADFVEVPSGAEGPDAAVDVEESKVKYGPIITKVFMDNRTAAGATSVDFTNEDIRGAAKSLKMKIPQNPPDVLYNARYRGGMPDDVLKAAPKGFEWVIRGTGRGKYRFGAVPQGRAFFRPNPSLTEIKVPDSTPGVIARYALNDEQALLAVIRYNRLLDIFTGVACYSLQTHWKTSVEGIGQIETDEVYVGVNKHGAHFVLPVEAKSAKDVIGVVQIEQNVANCHSKKKTAALTCRPIAAQFMADEKTIALFEFEAKRDVPGLVEERHYRLVPASEVTEADLAQYKTR